MATVAGWVWEDEVDAAVEYVARWVGYAYDGSDWMAIETGLLTTDADREDGWFDYPICGRPQLTVWLAVEPEGDFVNLRVTGRMGRVLRARIETLLALMSDPQVRQGRHDLGGACS